MENKDWLKIHDYCMAKPCAYESRPFGELPICYRVAGKIFAQLSTNPDWFKITLKTNPEAAYFYRQTYPGIVVRGYHCPASQQPYWNTIELDHFSESILYQMLDEAYAETVCRLPKKEQAKLPLIAEYRFVKTNGDSEVFATLCQKLDENLDEIVGNKFDRTQYAKFNLPDAIHDVILVYHGEDAVGCGSYKFYDDETVELKRIYLSPSCRGKGLSKELLRRLEADARIAGFRYAILESGEPLANAMALYKKMGYKIIPNYGQYVDMPASVCMSKKI